jgi:hypothetical protein
MPSMNHSVIKVVLWSTIGYGLLMIPSAHAYIDPGTGSIILQAIIGAVAAALVIIKVYWYKLTDLFKPRKPEPQKPASAPDDDKGE